jgi:hypothetical protein
MRYHTESMPIAATNDIQLIIETYNGYIVRFCNTWVSVTGLFSTCKAAAVPLRIFILSTIQGHKHANFILFI